MSRKKFLLKQNIKAEYYKNCAELPLNLFIQCVVTQKLHGLIISGKPTDEQLNEAWGNINQDYQDLTEDHDGDYLLGLFSNISYLDERLRIIYNIVAYLEIKRSEGLILLLQEMGFDFEYSEESLLTDLKLTVSQAKFDKVNLEMQQNELKELQSKGKQPTEYDYDSILSTLSKYQGYQLRSKDLTVTEFIAILNRFKNENNPLKGQSSQEVE